MCVVSMISDHYYEKWKPWTAPYKYDPCTVTPGPITITPQSDGAADRGRGSGGESRRISKEEIDEFRILLERAREYDRKNGEPDCQLESKKQRLLDLAKELGVEIDFL